MAIVPSIVDGNPYPVLSPVLSATPLYCADVLLTLWEWLDALVVCDILSGKSVKAAVMGLMPSQPRASW